MLEGFLLGIIVTASLTAAAFFLVLAQLPRSAVPRLRLAFLIEGVNRIGFLVVERPNEGSPAIYVVRLLAFLLILRGHPAQEPAAAAP